MSRYRALALRASLVAVLAATVGAATLTPTAASATPAAPAGTATASSHYPPTKPKMVVNRGSVKAGQKVRASGRQFVRREWVNITITFKAKGSNKSKVVKRAVLRADSKGRFAFSLRLARQGTVLIKAKGVKSNKSAYATVRVTSKKGGGAWVIKPASLSTSTTGGNTGLVSATDTGSAGLAVAGLGAMALLGSAVVTRRVVRRRRGVGVPA